MQKRFLFVALLSISIHALADIPIKGTDPFSLEADFVGTEILGDLEIASANCRQNFLACGPESEFLWLPQLGTTDDGRTATFWAGRWIPETYEPSVLWKEVVYLMCWTDFPPYPDYSGSTAVIPGVVWWNFVDRVLEAALANNKGKFSFSAAGWYGVHMSDTIAGHNAVAPADILITATVNKVVGAGVGEVDLNYSIVVAK